VRRPKAVS